MDEHDSVGERRGMAADMLAMKRSNKSQGLSPTAAVTINFRFSSSRGERRS